jgi:thiamine biosynthesis lipoprotein
MKLIVKVLFITCFVASLFTSSAQEYATASKEVKLMGCRFVFRVVADDEATAWKAINSGIDEITRIENLISSWDPSSQTSEINRNAGIQAVKVEDELFSLIQRSLKISQLTQGAFDISFASMDRIYTFDRQEKQLPSEETIENAKALIDWEQIELDVENSSVKLSKKGMKIGFGAIGKGYAANRAKAIIESIQGVHGGIVNASGDLSIWGKSSNKINEWNIKISDPSDPDRIMADILVNNTSVITSGDYEKYFTSGGRRYAHIIDPSTGIPTSGIKSVTIICKDAEIGDALATSVFVLGKEDGLYLINKLKGVEAIIVTDDNTIIHSDNLKLNYY